MWRFFRLGIKSNQCHGNQSQFRVIGTTCANADCDDKGEVLETVLNKENNAGIQNKNLASKAAKEYHNFLRHNPTSLHDKKVPFNYEPHKLKAIDGSLKEIQWNQYSKERSKVFSSQLKRGGSKLKNSTASKKSERTEIFDSKDEPKPQNEEEERFGTLSKNDRKFELLPLEKDELEENSLQDDYDRRLSIHQYGRKILALCQERKLKEALEVLEVEMKVQKAIPDNYCYNILINACGKAGYTKKAFDLYYQMKRRGLKVQKFALTGLFNACANSPYKLSEGITEAQRLRKQLKDEGKTLHPITYHAMIKAFGRCGDIATAFEIVDEMLEMKHNVTEETMNFLLQACISDKESGFRHALMVWRKMRILKIKPCIYSYNLLMRCVKECKAGDPQLISQLLETPAQLKGRPQSKNKISDKKSKKISVTTQGQSPIESSPGDTQLPNATDSGSDEGLTGGQAATADGSATRHSQTSVHHISEKNEIVRVDLAENMEMEIINYDAALPSKQNATELVLPNILSRKFDPGNAVSISSLETKEERLCLLNGMLGVLESMVEDKVKPTVVTFTYMLECLPPSKGMEEMLISSMEKCRLVPDVIFCNKLVHRRAMRNATQEAREVLHLMQKHRLCVDLITFGCLALTCRTPKDINVFLKDMDKAGFTPNTEIMAALLQNTLISHEYCHAIELLQKMRSFGISPNEKIINHLEKTRKVIREHIIKGESAGNVAEPPTPQEKRKSEEMRLFLMEYKHWLKKSKMELKDHPWAQFGYEEKRVGAVATIS